MFVNKKLSEKEMRKKFEKVLLDDCGLSGRMVAIAMLPFIFINIFNILKTTTAHFTSYKPIVL